MDTTKVITATELKTNLGKYLDYVSENNEVVITKNGNKFARITPYISEFERYLTVKEKSMDYLYGGKKVSYEEFMQIYERSELRMEFINGEIVLLDSPSPYHQGISGNLYIQLHSYLKGKSCKVFYAPFDVHFRKRGFDTPDVMQPDLIIVCDHETTVNSKGRYMGTPLICIEILSPSTSSKDMVIKLNTYMLSGVKEFWVVDPDKQTVLVYHFINFGVDEYQLFRSGDNLVSYELEGLEIPLEVIYAQ